MYPARARLTVTLVQQLAAPTVRPASSRRPALIGGCVIALVAAAGCSASSSTSASTQHPAAAPIAAFDDQGANPQPCMAHQTRQPTPAYRAGDTAVSALELPMLAYYTANGDKPYCDGRPATAVDRAWLTLYVGDGADPAHVQRQLG